MKKAIVILTLMCLAIVWPLTASASGLNPAASEQSAIDDAGGSILTGDFGDDSELPQQGANGDPHDLGGGLRSGEGPPEGDGEGGLPTVLLYLFAFYFPVF